MYGFQIVRMTPGIPEMHVLRDISLVIQVMASPILCIAVPV